MTQLKNAVVASLGERSPHPYSSIAMSPNRKLAIVAGKDTLQLIKVEPDGLSQIRSMRISQHFQTASVAADGRNFDEDRSLSLVQDTFGMVAKQAQTPRSMTNVNVVLTDVAWSLRQGSLNRDDSLDKEELATATAASEDDNDSIIAAAGSNGVVVVWSTRRAFFQEHASVSSLADQQPEAILSQHSRAVNRLAWHPRRRGLLLTASQDATVKLWVRRASTFQDPPKVDVPGYLSWFRLGVTPTVEKRSYSWQCRNTFEPKSEAVRDVRWSPFQQDIFAIVTASGSLIVYNMYVKGRAIVKVSAHAGDATTLDWHPTRPGIVATGGAGDRCVKIWDLGHLFSVGNDESNMLNNSNTESSSETERSGYASSSTQVAVKAFNASRSVTMLHILTVSATVTRLRWRPPAVEVLRSDDEEPVTDRHDAMLAVATAPIKGASAGGSGVLSLWSYHRPYMPLSVLEGHKEGAVTDFFFLDTPQSESQLRHLASAPPNYDSRRNNNKQNHTRANSEETDMKRSPRVPRKPPHEIGNMHHEPADSDERDQTKNSTVRIWQHVLSVGRDGRCLLQSFARGDRPISRVPPSCFAMANYSPFQSGYGSLQFFSVRQKVPSGPRDDFFLTGLRQDAVTARAPGVFQEYPPLVEERSDSDLTNSVHWAARKRLPDHVPELVFNVVDAGELTSEGKPVEGIAEAVMIAPEVVHLSRFANLYRFYPDEDCPTRVDLCLHNGSVAESLQCGSLARMWMSVASMIHGSGLDELPQKGSLPSNVMQFVLLPTLKSLLEERADAGDVQTCVALCEVLQVIHPNGTTRIPDLHLDLVREWYLAYIDLLRDMCLFSLASFLIRSCKDPFIGALNQQSTTIHESCPSCMKPLQLQDFESSSGIISNVGVRACKTCRRRLGFCFLCHEPVRGMFVWCPGCGHGGHLDHALEWFCGLDGQPIRETCPTGCGHRCNFLQPLSAFPRTGSCQQIL